MVQEKSKRLFGEMLVADSVVTRAQLDEALAIQEEQKRAQPPVEILRIGTILGNLGYLDLPTIEEYVERVMKDYM